MTMKKLFILALMVTCTIAAKAQFYVGGTFGLSAETTKVDDESHTNSVYSISPEAGYNINKVWAVGLSVGLSYTVNGGGEDVTTWGISPYARATFAHAGAVDFFAEAAFAYENAEVGDVSVDGWGIGLRPGILVSLSDCLQLVGRTTLFKYATAGDSPYKLKQTGISLSPTNVELGILFNF